MSKDHNLAQQLKVAKQYGIPEENVFYDKITGKRTDRPEYDRTKALLVKGDEVYFKEIDITLREGETITEACKRLGIDRSTYYRRTKESV